MKVYRIPDEVPFIQPDYRTYDLQAELKREESHSALLKKHLKENGYTGKHTGKVVSYQVADGYAKYMLADGNGRYGPSFLFHLPYGDGYQHRGIEHYPKKAIIEQIERAERWSSTAPKFSQQI